MATGVNRGGSLNVSDTRTAEVFFAKGGGDRGGGLVAFAVVFTAIAGFWKFLVKVGQPGRVMFVPIYNAYVILKIAGRPGWWLVLSLIPVVNIWLAFRVALDIASSFGTGTGFGIGLVLLSPIFYMILGFGSSEYLGPAAQEDEHLGARPLRTQH